MPSWIHGDLEVRRKTNPKKESRNKGMRRRRVRKEGCGGMKLLKLSWTLWQTWRSYPPAPHIHLHRASVTWSTHTHTENWINTKYVKSWSDQMQLMHWEESWSSETPIYSPRLFFSIVIATEQEEAEQSPEGRRKWTDCPPDTLLNALAQAQLTYSTLGNMDTGHLHECRSVFCILYIFICVIEK